MKIISHERLIAPFAVLCGLLFLSTPLLAANNNNNGKLTIYLTRHAEKETLLTPSSSGAPNGFYQVTDEREPYLVDAPIDDETGEPATPLGMTQDEVCFVSKCAEILSDKGELRAALLANWLRRHGVIRKLDAVYASHKIRTQQTVEPTAVLADLDVQPIPADGTELNPESTKSTVCPTLSAIRAAQEDGLDTIIVAGHSGTLYKIMGDGRDECEGEGLGFDIDNDRRFPKDEDGKVRDFGDLWKIVLLPNGEAQFKFRKNLQPMYLSTFDRAR